MKCLKLALLAIAALTAWLTHAQAQITNYFPSISSGSTVCTGCTSGNLIGSSGGAIVDSGVAIANVPRLNAANSFTATQNITTSGINFALGTSQTASGTTTTVCVVGSGVETPCLNLINIVSDSVDASSPSNALDYLQLHAVIGGSTVKGARQMLNVTGDFTSPTSPSNTNRNYAAIVGQMNVLSGDGGTGITPSTALGAFFGGNFVVRNSVANLYSVTGLEVDNVNGAAVLERIGISVVSQPGVQGGTRDEAYHVGSVAGSGAIGWLTALGLSDGNSGAPLDSTNGCVICTDGSVHTIKTFADLSSYTISGNILKFNNFQVSGAGELLATGEFIGPATGAGVIQISPTIAGNQSYIQFLDAGTSKFIVGKQTDNSFIMVDAANSNALFLTVSTGGNLTLGETGKSTTIVGALVVSTMTQTAVAQSGTVCYNSGTGAVTYDATLGCLTSLEELKDIKGPITGALDEVAAMRPFWFAPINRPIGSDFSEQPGFGAHQIEQVDRRLVGYDADGNLRGVRYAEMTAVLAAAINELSSAFRDYRSSHP